MIRKGLVQSQKTWDLDRTWFGSINKEQEPNSVTSRRQLKPPGVVSGSTECHPKRVAVWSSFSHSKGRQSKRDACCSIAVYLVLPEERSRKSWWIRFWEEVAQPLFPAQDHQDRYKRYRGEFRYWKRGFPGSWYFSSYPS